MGANVSSSVSDSALARKGQIIPFHSSSRVKSHLEASKHRDKLVRKEYGVC